MKKITMARAALLGALSVSLAFMGCGSKDPNAALKKSGKPTKVVGYLLGQAPAGMPDVLAKINEKLAKDLNAELELNYIGWSDLNSKYPLILASGEGVDWIYTSDWCQYAPEAARGAFAEITPEAVKKYMPLHEATINPEAWKQTKVNGKIYMVTTPTPDHKVPVVLIRKDLREKYGVPAIKKFSDLEAYLAAIKANEKEMIPINIDGGYDLGQPFDGLLREFAPPTEPIQIATNTIGSPFAFNPENQAPAAYYSLEAPYIDGFKKAAAVMKKWYDQGYINKNPYANTVLSRDSFSQGKSAIGFGNSMNIQGTLAQAQKNGYDVEILPVLSSAGKYRDDPYTNNGFAVAASSKNYELSLRIMDLLMHDPAYSYLAYFGIEGKNYVVTADGKIALPEGVTAESNTYPPDAAGFWFTNKDLHKPNAAWSDAYIALRSDVKKYLTVTPYAGFTFSVDKVKSEVATITGIWATYANPIMVGGAGDPEVAITALAGKLKAANIDKVRTEVDSQIKAFAEAIK